MRSLLRGTLRAFDNTIVFPKFADVVNKTIYNPFRFFCSDGVKTEHEYISFVYKSEKSPCLNVMAFFPACDGRQRHTRCQFSV